MALYGPRKGQNRDYYYVQTNNPTEAVLKTYHAKAWLVSCGPTAMINCIAPLGYNVDVYSPTQNWKFQPEEMVMDFLTDPRNVSKLNSIRDLPKDISKQEVPQYYPYATSVLFGATAQFNFGINLKKIYHHLFDGGTVQLCLKDPGHYIAVVGYDSITEELVYNDSWPGRHEDGNGFNKRMSKVEFGTNVKNWAIWYSPKK